MFTIVQYSKRSRLSPHWAWWVLNEHGHPVAICWSLPDAVRWLTGYLST